MDSESYEYFFLVGRSDCPWCIKAEELLRTEGKEFTFMFHERDSVELQEAKSKNDWQTVPMVTRVAVINGENSEEEFIGGYTDLQNYIEKTRSHGEEED